MTADTPSHPCAHEAHGIANLHPLEAARQAALDRLGILDTPAEDQFESIVEIAAELMGVPITAISFVDRDRQWFKAQRGLEVDETPRSAAFCAHAILRDDPLVVTDATADVRFAHNPLVLNDPSIRSYAGVPISFDGSAPLGTLCVIDTVPREFSADKLAALAALARQVESQLSLRGVVHELAAANESLHQFTSVASHDLRAPIRNIRDLVDFIREDCDDSLDDTAHRHLDAIEGRTNTMQSLIDDLIAYARAGSHEKGVPDATPGDVIAEVLEGLAKPSPIAFRVSIEPDAAERLVPRVAFSLCLRNLVSNAITHAGGVDGSCAIDVTEDCGGIDLLVSDNGPGIEPEHHERIFEPFHRLQTDPTKVGSGIGLAIVRRTAQSHGGDVAVRSTPGAGATFTLRWPAA